MLPSSCVTPAGTSIEVQNEWEENTHTHTYRCSYTYIYIYAYTAVNRARMCMSPNKKYTGTWYTNQYNKQQYCTSTYIYVLIPGDTADHEQVWQPYAVDPYYSAISKWWPYLLALYINTDYNPIQKAVLYQYIHICTYSGGYN